MTRNLKINFETLSDLLLGSHGVKIVGVNEITKDDVELVLDSPDFGDVTNQVSAYFNNSPSTTNTIIVDTNTRQRVAGFNPAKDILNYLAMNKSTSNKRAISSASDFINSVSNLAFSDPEVVWSVDEVSLKWRYFFIKFKEDGSITHEE